MENIISKYDSYWIRKNGKLENVSSYPDTHHGYVVDNFKEKEYDNEDDAIEAAMEKGWIKLSTFMKDIDVEFIIETVGNEALKSLNNFFIQQQHKFKNVVFHLYKHHNPFADHKDFDIQYAIDNLYKIIDDIKNNRQRNIRDVLR